MAQSTEGSNRWTAAEKVLGVLTALLTLATGFLAYKTAIITQAKEQAQVVAENKDTDLSSLQSQYDMLKGQYNAAQAENARLRAQLGLGDSIDNSPATTGVSLKDVTPLSTVAGNYQFGPQTVNAKPYPQTLYFTDDSCFFNQATYQLDYKYKKFRVVAGLGDNSTADGVVFTVQVDKKTPSTVTLGLGQEPHPFETDVTGAFRITLTVRGSRCFDSDVTAVWIDPILTL